MHAAPVRRWLACAFVASITGATGLAACDGSTNRVPGPDDAGAIDVIAADVVVYVGSPVAVDAAQTGATEYGWNVMSAPSGSTVSTTSLGGATSARASFVPDIAGEYVLEIAAITGSKRGTRSVKVTAVAAPIFYLQASLGDAGRFIQYHARGNDQSNDRPVACPIRQSDERPVSDLSKEIFVQADMGLDWWEAPAGATSRIAFAGVQPSDDGGDGTAFLALGSTETSCEKPPLEIGHMEDGGNPAAHLTQPRFSPDGARVAFIDELGDGYTVETIAHDGTDRRILARFCADGIDDCAGFSKVPARPQWFDLHTVGWARDLEQDSGSAWEVILASDSASPEPHVHMTCPGTVPRTIAFLRDGSVLANAAVGPIADLVLYRPSHPGGICQIVRNLTNLPNQGSYARDFTLSPDEAEVAFLRRGTLAGEPTPDASEPTYGGTLYTVPLNGGLASSFGGASEYAFFGPRYVASASQIAWDGVVASYDFAGANVLDAGTPAVKVGSRGGTAIRPVVVSDIDAGVYVLGGGNGGSIESGCSFAGRYASRGGALLALVASLLLGVRRRYGKSVTPRPRL